jgi:hypothetical protein
MTELFEETKTAPTFEIETSRGKVVVACDTLDRLTIWREPDEDDEAFESLTIDLDEVSELIQALLKVAEKGQETSKTGASKHD